MSNLGRIENSTISTRKSTLSSRSNSDNNLAGKSGVMTRSHSRPTTPSENEAPTLKHEPRRSTVPVSRNKNSLKERSVSPRITAKPMPNDTPKASTVKPRNNMSDFDMLLYEAKKGNTKTLMAVKTIQGETTKIKKIVNAKGRETAQSELLFSNLAIVAGLMCRLNEKQEWTLRHAASLLPRIIEMLESSVYRNTGLESLEEISVHMVPLIVSTLSTRMPSVDVEADVRRRNSELCAKELRRLVSSRNQIFKKMDQDSSFKLDSIMEVFKNL